MTHKNDYHTLQKINFDGKIESLITRLFCKFNGQCKRTGACNNELVVAFFSTGGGVKGKKNLYLLTL